jgi:hypothetical protein
LPYGGIIASADPNEKQKSIMLNEISQSKKTKQNKSKQINTREKPEQSKSKQLNET